MSPRSWPVVLAAMALAALLRLPGIEFDLPLFTHPDEQFIVDPAMRMLATGNPNPGWFEYPSAVLYLNAAVYGAGARLTGEGPAGSADPVRLRRWGRMITVVFAVATVPVVYAAATLAFGELAGAAAAFLLAASRLHTANSFAVSTDAPAAFAAALAIWGALGIAVRGATVRRHLLAGAAVGLAAGTKYPAVFVAASVAAAHLAVSGPRPRELRRKGAVAGVAAAVAAFLATTPYALLDFETFRATLAWQSDHFRSGHAGAQAAGATGYSLYLQWLPGMIGRVGGVLALAGLLTAVRTNWRAAVTLVAFPLAYVLVMGSHKVAFERYMVVMIPAAVVAASASVRLVWLAPRGAIAAAVAVALLLAWSTAVATEVREARAIVFRRTLPDTRVIADRWIRENLPRGARVARENYTPPLDGSGLEVTKLGYFGLIQTPDLESRFDFLIASSGDYRRFVSFAGKYPAQARAYADVFARFEEVRKFAPDYLSTGPIIHVLATESGKKLLAGRATSPPGVPGAEPGTPAP